MLRPYSTKVGASTSKSVIETRTIKIVDYDPQWSLVFADLKHVIEAVLESLSLVH